MKPAFVISGQQPSLGVVRSLGKMKIPVILLYYYNYDFAQYSRYITKSVFISHPENFEKEFIEQLLKIVEEFGSGVLFPVSDEAVVVVSKNKKSLDKYFKVACTNWEVTQKFIEKKYTYALANENLIPAPKTIIPLNIADVENYSKQIQFPCLVKPSQSHLFFDHFQTKMMPVENRGELISVYKQTADAGLEVMLQEIIPGDDSNVVNYNAYFCDGKPLQEFTAQQIRKAPPWWGSPRVVLSKDIPEVIEPGRKILKAMGFNGYACVEFKKDQRNGIYKLIEVNGRHNLSTLLAVRCGINFPYLHYKHILDSEEPLPGSFKKNIYWIDFSRDIICNLKFLTKEQYSLMQYLRPYFRPHVFAIFDLKDFKPFRKRFFKLKKLLSVVIDLITGRKKK